MKKSVLSSAITATTLAAMALPLSAVAQPSSIHRSMASYDHAGLQYITQHLDDYDCDQDGLSLYGSKHINGGWFGQGRVTDVSGDTCGSTSVRIDAGYRVPFNYSFNLYATLGVERTDPDVGASDTGAVAAAGFRGMVAHRVEGKVELAHHTIYDGETALNLNLTFWPTQRFGATIDGSVSADSYSLAAGVRMNF